MPGARALGPSRPWKDQRVVLGVTGGIAAYKSVQLARDLTRLGAQVDVVLTRSATEFVQPLSFEGVTGRPVLTQLFSVDGAARHLTLGQDADVVCIAPATADFIARAAQGRADDLLTTTLLATRAPVVVCPAMNDRMYAHVQTQANLERLDELGYRVAGPATGPLAVGEGEGPGRMLEPSQIVEHVGRALSLAAPWSGRSVLVTSGPTREAVDPVRYLSNRSSGRMGQAVAQAAWRRGASVTLVTGPTVLPPPEGVDVVRVESADEMLHAVRERIGATDVVVFAAAVADFRPERGHDRKLKRTRDAVDRIEVTENPDVALETREDRRAGAFVVGFALETEDLLDHARHKLTRKGFDLIVANDATDPDAGFDVDTNRVHFITEDEIEAMPLLSKLEVAEALLDRVARQGLRPGATDPGPS